MPDKEDKKDDEFKPEFDIVEQDDKSTDKADKPDGGGKIAKNGYADDERLSAGQRDDSEHEDDDSEIKPDKGDETAEEIEAKRERRRRERRAQKARQQQARERDSREMHFLRTRNEQLERAVGSVAQRVTRNEVMQVDGRLEQLKGARNEAEEVLARAIEANNGADVVKLNRTIRELENGISRLSAYKQELEKAKPAEEAEEGAETAEQPDAQRRTQGPPPSVKKNLQVFAARHSWFNPDSTDEDSQIVKALDAAVAAEGYDPATKDYWVELEDRMKRRLPERMKALRGNANTQEDDDDLEDDDPPPRRNGNGGEKPKGGPRMASGSQTRGTGKQFMLSGDRKRAMIEAGVWDDPELRDKYIRSYAKWDKENPAQAGR